ncbi:hypothetical protein ADK38_18060, partial [Streptomyces varsoviensis]
TERCARGGYEFAEDGPVSEDCTSDESATLIDTAPMAPIPSVSPAAGRGPSSAPVEPAVQTVGLLGGVPGPRAPEPGAPEPT